MAYGTKARLYANKTRVELADLANSGVVVTGNAFASVLFVKGRKGEAERTGGTLLSGTDGTALRAALSKLGYEPQDWCAVACWTKDGGFLSPDTLELAIATLDPDTVVACDDEAAALVRDAYVDGLYGLETGRVSMVRGMRVLVLGGFEAALQSMDAKQVMWARLKQIPPLAAPY